ncbi:unnamed protein product [Caretta caretta]
MVGLRKSFGHLLLEENEESRSQSDEEFDFEGFTEEEVGRTDMEWMQELSQQLSGLGAVRPNNIPEAEELAFAMEEEEKDEADIIPTSTTTVAGLETALRWFETQDVEPIKIMQLRSLLQFLKQKQHSSKKQKELTDFFKKN